MTNIIIGLDIGTSFVRAVVGVINEDDSVEILSVAKKPSSGFLRHGAIVNIESTKNVIKQVIDEVEQNFGYEVNSCVTGIGGKYIESLNSHGFVAISSIGKRDRAITEDDINRVLDASNAVPIPPDRDILHLIPKDYIVNGVSGYKQETALNSLAVRLEVDVHIITASKTQISNITQCVERAGYELDKVFLKTLAAVDAVMMKEERDLGSILIDLGGGTTDVIVIVGDAPACTASIPIGGILVTNDIAFLKGVPTETAERLKLENGCCWSELLEDNDKEVVIPAFGGRPAELTTRSELCTIIQSRMEEIFNRVRDEIVQRSELKQLAGSIILTGGGAQMLGVVELTQYVFRTSSVRIGSPGSLGGVEESYRNPEFATAVGLVLADKSNVRATVSEKQSRKRKEKTRASNVEEDAPVVKKESVLAKFKKFFF